MKAILKYSKIVFLLFSVTTLLIFTACHKPGVGGHSSVSGNVMHHTKLIPNAIVYIKYGAKEFPGTDVSKYDDHMTSDTNAHYEFKNLYKGDYFLYGVGYDNAIMLPVTGGIGITLKSNKSSTTDVPVTE
ncbi:MAG: hypothetical protein ACXVPU_13370 [Bacteroidia bacterium]